MDRVPTKQKVDTPLYELQEHLQRRQSMLDKVIEWRSKIKKAKLSEFEYGANIDFQRKLKHKFLFCFEGFLQRWALHLQDKILQDSEIIALKQDCIQAFMDDMVLIHTCFQVKGHIQSVDIREYFLGIPRTPIIDDCVEQLIESMHPYTRHEYDDEVAREAIELFFDFHLFNQVKRETEEYKEAIYKKEYSIKDFSFSYLLNLRSRIQEGKKRIHAKLQQLYSIEHSEELDLFMEAYVLTEYLQETVKGR